MLAGQRHDRHAAHRVPDQDHRHVPGSDRLDDQVQVGAEPVDAGHARRGPPGPAVVPLVPEHETVLAQGGPLEVPAVLVQRVAVAEDDGVRLGWRVQQSLILGGRFVDLHVQRDPIVGQHGERLAA